MAIFSYFDISAQVSNLSYILPSECLKDDWSRPLLIGLPQIRTGPLDGLLLELERKDPYSGHEPQMTGAS